MRGVVISGGRSLRLSDDAAWLWHTVDAGKPTIVKFGGITDSSPIDLRKGQMSPWVNSVRELADGRLTFATGSGLCLWDGTHMATYTGPSFDPALRESIAGNSGLPGNCIHDIVQDRVGRLWVATDKGVCRIDGQSWQTLTPPAGFISFFNAFNELGDVWAEFVAADGRIFLGSRDSGITIVDAKGVTARTLYSDGETNDWITAIAEDSAGRIWFGVVGSGVLCYDGKSLRRFDHSNSPRWIVDEDIRALCIGADDSLWIGSTSGLSRVCPDGVIQRFTTVEGLPGNMVWHLATDRSGAVWAITDQGIAIYKHGWKYADLRNLPSEMFAAFGCVYQDRAGGFWIGGAEVVHVANVRLIAGNPRDTRITDFEQRVEREYPALPQGNSAADWYAARDSTGQIIGYESGHLLSFDGKSWQDLSPLLNRCGVWNLQADKEGRVWVCTGGAGLIGIQGKAVQRYNDDPDSAKSCIYTIGEASNGDLYVGTQYGLWRLKGTKWEDLGAPPFMQATHLVIDGQDRVWVVDPTMGLLVYQANSFTRLSHSFPLWGKDVSGLRLTAEGNIEVDTIDHSQDPAAMATYRWLPHTPLAYPERVKK